ncbi:MAG: hypothetical protein ACPGRW_06055 [Flavobacteriaceae bacterium]
MKNKHHYRAVFKSDHLGSADLEEMQEDGKPLIFTIKEVKQEYQTKVAGRKIDANIAYFLDEKIKPLVLNATNSKQVSKFAGSKFVEDWNLITIELYIDSAVKMKGEVVGGVRIKPIQPNSTKRDFNNEISLCKSVIDLQDLWREMSESEQVIYNNSVTKRKGELQKSVA